MTIAEDRVQVTYYALFLTHVPEIGGSIFVQWALEIKIARSGVQPNKPCRNQRGPLSSVPMRSRYTQYSV